MATAALAALTLGLGACSGIPSAPSASRIISSVEDIAPIVQEAASGDFNAASVVGPAINAIATYAPGAQVPLTQLQGDIESTITNFGGATTTAAKVAAAVKSLPAVMSGAQAVQVLATLSTRAGAGIAAATTGT